MAIDHSSRAFKRFKRNNVFPHLVAEDLANGIEHTPIDRFKLHEWAGGMGSVNPRTSLTATANALETAGNGQSAATLRDVAAQLAQNRPTYVDAKSQNEQINNDPNIVAPKNTLEIIKFPSDVGENKGVPYILFKIFETKTGDVPLTDQTTQSLRNGAGAVNSAITAISTAVPGGDVALAAAGGGLVAGATGAVLAGGFAAGFGVDTIDAISNNIFGITASGEKGFISRSKQLLSEFNLKRNIEQLSVVLALFMPEGINTNYDNEYEALSVTATLGAAGFATQALAAKGGSVETKSPYIMEAATALLGKLVGNEDVGKLGLFATTGMVRNPQLEMIYSSPVLRRFTFDFRLVPRNATESEQIKRIINELKYYSAPEIPDGLGGRYFIPPSQFEIEFYDGKNQPNSFLFKTKKCVLSGISIDYAPNGFATFASGAPVETRMQLTFQETVIIDKKAVRSGY